MSSILLKNVGKALLGAKKSHVFARNAKRFPHILSGTLGSFGQQFTAENHDKYGTDITNYLIRPTDTQRSYHKSEQTISACEPENDHEEISSMRTVTKQIPRSVSESENLKSTISRLPKV